MDFKYNLRPALRASSNKKEAIAIRLETIATSNKKLLGLLANKRRRQETVTEPAEVNNYFSRKYEVVMDCRSV